MLNTWLLLQHYLQPLPHLSLAGRAQADRFAMCIQSKKSRSKTQGPTAAALQVRWLQPGWPSLFKSNQVPDPLTVPILSASRRSLRLLGRAAPVSFMHCTGRCHLFRLKKFNPVKTSLSQTFRVSVNCSSIQLGLSRLPLLLFFPGGGGSSRPFLRSLPILTFA